MSTALLAPTGLSLDSADDTGLSVTDRLTYNGGALTITGSGDTGALVALFEDRNGNGQMDDSEQLATVLVGSTGVWSCDVSLSEGTHTLMAWQSKVDSLNSPPSEPLMITVDQTAPDMTSSIDLRAGNDSGRAQDDDLTNVTSGLEISGNGAVVDSIITLFDDTDLDERVDPGESLASLAITSAGSWSIAVMLAAGKHALRAAQSDQAGNSSRGSDILWVTVDTAAPDAPTGMRLDGYDDSGFSESDGITRTTSELTISGRGEEGASVTLFRDLNGNKLLDNNELLANSLSVQDGEWRCDLSLAADIHTLRAFQTDRAGNNGSVATLLLSVDQSVPAAVTALKLDPIGDTGESNSDGITNATGALTISGRGEAGAVVTLMDGSELLGTTVVTATGAWSCAVDLQEKVSRISAYQADLAGNRSVAATLEVAVDRTAPATLGNLYLTPKSDTGVTGDNLTRLTSDVTISGNESEGGCFLTLFDDRNNNSLLDAGEALTTVAISKSGDWSVSSSLSSGSHSLRVIQSDCAGNVSPVSDRLVVTVDSGVPAVVTGLDLATEDDSGWSASDNITNRADSLTISGVGEQDATVILFDDSNNNGQWESSEPELATLLISNSDGSWQTDIISLTNGTHAVRAIQEDYAGNRSVATAALSVVVDTAAPTLTNRQSPRLASEDDSGSSKSDGITRNTTGMTFTGSGSSGTVALLFLSSADSDSIDEGNLLGTATVAANGSWSIDATVMPDEYSQYTFVRSAVSDSAGNISAASDALVLVIDTVSPLVPVDLDLNDDDDDGEVNNDNRTSQSRGLTMSGGNGEQGNVITLFDDKNENGKMDSSERLIDIRDVNGDGYWSGDINLAEGRHNILAFQTDAAGNISAMSETFTIRIADTDTSRVEAPVITGLADDDDTGSSNKDRVTNKTSALTLSGTAKSGLPLVLFQDSNYDNVPDTNEKLTTVSVANSAWSTDIKLAAGTYSIKAFQINSDGKNSQISDPLTLMVDVAAAAPTGLDLAESDDGGLSSSDNITRQTSALTISGNVEEDAVALVLFDDKNSNDSLDSGESLGTANVTSSIWSTEVNLATGSHTVKAIQTDLAGNRSAASSALRIVIDNIAPAAPSGLDLASSDDDGSSASDNITSETTALTISGSGGEVGAVLLLLDDQTELATINVTAASWSADVDLSAGTHALKAVQVDAASNRGAVSSALFITIDDVAPMPPTVLDLAASDDNGASNSDNITSQTSALTISGSVGEVGATLVLFDDKDGDGIVDAGEALTTTKVTSTTWSADISLSKGTHAIKAIQSDVAGNSSGVATNPPLTVVVTVDTVATPTALDLAAADDNGTSNSDNITSLTSGLTIGGGSGVKGAKLVLFDDKNSNGVVDSGEALSTTNITGTTWSSDIKLAVGTHAIKAIQKGVAGKADSIASDPLSVVVTVDTLAAPTALDLAAADDNGVSNSDNITSNTSGLTISGSSGVKGAKLVLFDDKNGNSVVDSGEALSTTNVTGTTWSSDIKLAVGTHAIKAIQKGVAGKVDGIASAPLSIVVTTPVLPVLAGLDLAATDDVGKSSSDNITKNTKDLTISGKSGSKGAVVTLFNDKDNNGQLDNGELLGTVGVTAATGLWSKDITLAAGTHTIRAVQKSGAVVSPAASEPLFITVDTTVPSAPLSLDLDADDDNGTSNSDNITSKTTSLHISGSGEPGATVTLFIDKNRNDKQDSNEKAWATGLVVGSDSRWRSSDLAQAIGTHSIRAFQTDIAGNVSALSSALNLSIISDKSKKSLSFNAVSMEVAFATVSDVKQQPLSLWSGSITGNS
ncbi:MAG: hypothetical protein HQL60_02000 [Magnetococcales bacterium]|nr:hypothetical protein [Magnetococcales bacterium]